MATCARKVETDGCYIFGTLRVLSLVGGDVKRCLDELKIPHFSFGGASLWKGNKGFLLGRVRRKNRKMNPSLFYGKKNFVVRPAGGDEGESEDSCLSASDESDSDYIPSEDDDDVGNNSSESESISESDVEESQQRAVPASSSADPIPTTSKGSRNLQWTKVSGCASVRDMPEWLGSLPPSTSIREPIDYFRYFFDANILKYIVEQSNLYAVQKNPAKPLQLTIHELEEFLGSILYMSLIVVPRTRLYWSSFFRIPQVSEMMSRDRWEEIKSKLHFNDNSYMPTPDTPNRDKLYKVRPLVRMLLEKYNNIPLDRMLCIDEQMVPFKGASSLKQYMPSKPTKWGYKIFVLCDDKGITYNFEIFTGKIEPLPNVPDMGASSNIVLRLAEIIPQGVNHLLYCDNWFTSLHLMTELAKRNIFYLGTVRSNRLPGCKLISDKELKQKGRGSFEEQETQVDGQCVRVVKWQDNRPVVLASTFSSAEPVGKIKRFDRKMKEKVDVQCPSLVFVYNKFMGGVDLLDALISLYRIRVRSKKYYHRLFFHLLDMATVTSWLLYRRDCIYFGVPKKNQLQLFSFTASIAEALCKEGKSAPGTKKRGRPSGGIDAEHEKKKKLGHSTKPIPQKNVRTDNVGHWPLVSEKRGRCKLPHCKGSPSIICQKCCVHLCLEKKRNCFIQFHTT